MHTDEQADQINSIFHLCRSIFKISNCLLPHTCACSLFPVGKQHVPLTEEAQKAIKFTHKRSRGSSSSTLTQHPATDKIGPPEGPIVPQPAQTSETGSQSFENWKVEDMPKSGWTNPGSGKHWFGMFTYQHTTCPSHLSSAWGTRPRDQETPGLSNIRKNTFCDRWTRQEMIIPFTPSHHILHSKMFINWTHTNPAVTAIGRGSTEETTFLLGAACFQLRDLSQGTCLIPPRKSSTCSGQNIWLRLHNICSLHQLRLLVAESPQRSSREDKLSI